SAAYLYPFFLERARDAAELITVDRLQPRSRFEQQQHPFGFRDVLDQVVGDPFEVERVVQRKTALHAGLVDERYLFFRHGGCRGGTGEGEPQPRGLYSRAVFPGASLPPAMTSPRPRWSGVHRPARQAAPTRDESHRRGPARLLPQGQT